MFIDNFFIEFMHILEVIGGEIFTPFFRVISFIGEKGWFFILIGCLLGLRRKTRWVGLTCGFAIGISWLFSSFVIKPIVCRLRPYQSASNIIYEYWINVGSPVDNDFSFPSGHVAAITAFFLGLLLTIKKPYRKTILVVGIISIILMAFSRMYFMQHYFTDCLVGFLIGIIMTLISKFVVKIVYNLFKSNENNVFINFCLNFDIIEFFTNKIK